MATKNFRRPSGSAKKSKSTVIGKVLDEYLQSNEPLAVAFRNWKEKKETAKRAVEAECDSRRLFSEVFPHTEPCVDLKMITCQAGRMGVGEYIDGILTRDDEYHFRFVQNDPVGKRRVTEVHRNPHVYVGRCINVNRKDDGTLYPTFNRPPLTESFTFQDFCREAIEELQMLAGLIK